jgi:hypothetical protein
MKQEISLESRPSLNIGARLGLGLRNELVETLCGLSLLTAGLLKLRSSVLGLVK